MADAHLGAGSRLRHVKRADHARVLKVVDAWWGGRPMSARLSHIYFVHFRPTSFVIESDDELLAFLLGFVSQTAPNEAYIHYVGVHPDYRRLGLARRLYDRFFAVASLRECTVVRSHTTPDNRLSVAFHGAMGFDIDPGDAIIDDVPVWRDFSGPGEHRVRFVKHLRPVLPEYRHGDQDAQLVAPVAGTAR